MDLTHAALTGLASGWNWMTGHATVLSTVVSAIATVVVALLTLSLRSSSKTLAALSDRQTKIIDAQTAIARAQLLAEHRPRLRVRHVFLRAGRLPAIGDTIKGSLVVVNIGGTDAVITDSKYCFYATRSRDALPVASPLDQEGDVLIVRDTVLHIGESCTIPIEAPFKVDGAGAGTFLPLGKNDWTLYVMGQIQYRDEGGNERFMGFCRQWAAEGTFQAVNDPDYEYED